MGTRDSRMPLVNGMQTHKVLVMRNKGSAWESSWGRPHAQAGWGDVEQGHGMGMVWDRRRLSTGVSHPRLHTLKGL